MPFYLRLKIINLDILITILNFLCASDELERHGEYFLNWATSILEALKVFNSAFTIVFHTFG